LRLNRGNPANEGWQMNWDTGWKNRSVERGQQGNQIPTPPRANSVIEKKQRRLKADSWSLGEE